MDSIEHYPFCDRVRLVSEELFRLPRAEIVNGNRGIGIQEFFLLAEEMSRDHFLLRLLLVHVVYTLQNLSRVHGVLPRDRCVDRARTLLRRAAAGNKWCLCIARGLSGPPGPLRQACTAQTLPEVSRKRPRDLPLVAGGIQ